MLAAETRHHVLVDDVLTIVDARLADLSNRSLLAPMPSAVNGLDACRKVRDLTIVPIFRLTSCGS
jgi:hypothetical protein